MVEDRDESQSSLNKEFQHLELPMSVLTVNRNDLAQEKRNISNSQDKIYLFGVYSSFLLFGMGLMNLCDDIEDKETLENNLVKAMRLFTLCAAIAAEGTNDEDEDEGKKDENESKKTYLERKWVADQQENQNMPKDFHLRGLYPHRLTHLAALGKVFAATSKVSLILSKNTKYDYWGEIDYLLGDLHDVKAMNRQSNPFKAGQKRYNGHLADQLAKVQEYLQAYKTNNVAHSSSLIEIRNRIVSDIFKILRGDKV